MTSNLTAEYWNHRYQNGDHPWDIQNSSPALLGLISQHVALEEDILIPGAGFGHEVEDLWNAGYRNIHVCEWAAEAAQRIAERTDLPVDQIHIQDFFAMEGQFQAVLEMTFFCAIPRDQRQDYVEKVYSLLAPGGLLLGLLWNHEFDREGPPFGGSRDEYHNLFSSRFEILKMETSIRSMSPRLGREYEIVFRKKEK